VKSGAEDKGRQQDVFAVRRLLPCTFPEARAVIEAARAMFDNPKAGIGRLKETVRAYEGK